MNREDFELITFDASTRLAQQDETVEILAVGEADEWRRKGNRLPMDGRVVFSSFQDVSPELLVRLSPMCVLSPALSHRFDCIDLAQLLHGFGYKGRYRAMSHELPRPELVEREIEALCPGLDFAVLVSG